MEREISRFRVTDDEGHTYTVVEFQNFIDTSTKGNRSELPGLKRLVLSTGQAVNFVDANTFQIVQNGVTIRRVA